MRRSSQITQSDVDGHDDGGAHRERCERHRDGMAQSAWLDPGERQLLEATEWYEQHGRFASVDWVEDTEHRGRPRLRDPRSPDKGWATDPDDMPNLSRSLTTDSNRSSYWIEPPATELEGWAVDTQAGATVETGKGLLHDGRAGAARLFS